jgi:GTP-binding protein
MLIKSAKFVISNSDIKGCPAPKLPEVAFIGRSNVGKSSLINMLVNHKGLAKTSAKPGKTQLINHFIVNDSWYLVDLPGYGYAQTSKTLRAGFSQIITNYISKRTSLLNLFVLIDCRLEPQSIDLQFLRWLGQNGVPFSLVFTKCDKLGKNKLAENIESYKKTLLEEWSKLPPSFLTSAASAMGRDDLLQYIDSICKQK